MLHGQSFADHSNHPLENLMQLQIVGRAQGALNGNDLLTATLKTERREKAMKRELTNQAFVYGLVSLVVLVSVPVLRFLNQLS